MDSKKTTVRDNLVLCQPIPHAACYFQSKYFSFLQTNMGKAYLANSNLGKFPERLQNVIEFRSLCVTTAVSLWFTYIKIMRMKYNYT